MSGASGSTQHKFRKVIQALEVSGWHDPPVSEAITIAEDSLETGKVVFFPSLGFSLAAEERQFLSAETVDPKAKNVSFDRKSGAVKHAVCDDATAIRQMMVRYCRQNEALLHVDAFPTSPDV